MAFASAERHGLRVPVAPSVSFRYLPDGITGGVMNRSFAVLLGFGMASTMAMSGSNDGGHVLHGPGVDDAAIELAAGDPRDNAAGESNEVPASDDVERVLATAERKLHCFYSKRHQSCDLQASR